METNEISLLQVKIFLFLRDTRHWVTNAEIAKATGAKYRTAAMHTKNMVEMGILDAAEVFPAHRFRMATKPENRNKAYYLLRLEQAAEVFGLGQEAA